MMTKRQIRKIYAVADKNYHEGWIAAKQTDSDNHYRLRHISSYDGLNWIAFRAGWDDAKNDHRCEMSNVTWTLLLSIGLREWALL